MKYELNTAQNFFTKRTSFEMLYEIKSKISLLKHLTEISNMNANDFLKNRQQIKSHITDCLSLTQVKMTILFDVKHKSLDLSEKVYLKLAKTEKSKYHLSRTSFLSIRKLKSYKILKQVFSLTYELNLSSSMKIHFVISIIHLEQTKKNKFERTISKILATFLENDEEIFVIEKILRNKVENDMKKYLIK